MSAVSVRVSRYRRNLKKKAVAYLGGSCVRCGYNKCVAAMDFHHRDPAQKDFSISGNGVTRSFEVVKAELDKCDLLCANCHREVYDEEVSRLTVRNWCLKLKVPTKYGPRAA